MLVSFVCYIHLSLYITHLLVLKYVYFLKRVCMCLCVCVCWNGNPKLFRYLMYVSQTNVPRCKILLKSYLVWLYFHHG